MKSGQRLPADPVEKEAALAFNRQLVCCRQAAEWGMRAIQGTFGRIRLPMDANDAPHRSQVLEVIVRLHNVRNRLVGVNQIRNVYAPIWAEDAEEVQIWDSFEEMVFGEMRRRDRVAKFHVIPADL